MKNNPCTSKADLKKNFTVLMPLYNGDCPKLFKDAIDSVLANSIKPTEIIVIVDGPIRKELRSILKLKENKHQFIKIYHLNQNRGITYALNYGLTKCTYELIARCDADDINKKNRFELQLNEFLNDSDLVMCGGQIIEDSDGKYLNKIVPTTNKKIIEYIKFRCPFNHMTVMFKKNEILEVGGYPNIPYREDYALWARLVAANYKVINVEDVLVTATTGKNMYKRRGNFKHIEYEIKLQNYLLKNGIISVPRMFSNLLLRLPNAVIPSWVREFIYKNFLRS